MEILSLDPLSFFLEILANLESTKGFIQIELGPQQKEEINSIEKAFDLLKENQINEQFYSEEIEREIEYISTNFSEIFNEDQKGLEMKNKMKTIEILERIISHTSLRLDNEDSLIDFINELYFDDKKYVNFYSYVYFNNVTSSKMNEFLQIFSYNDITHEIWDSLSIRLSQEIINLKEQKIRYKKPIGTNKPNKIISYSNQYFDGIINYFSKESDIKDEIDVSYSSKGGWDDPFSIFEYESDNHSFFTHHSDFEPWICIEFKNHKVRPLNYSIRSGDDLDNPRNFVLEGSNDKKKNG